MNICSRPNKKTAFSGQTNIGRIRVQTRKKIVIKLDFEMPIKVIEIKFYLKDLVIIYSLKLKNLTHQSFEHYNTKPYLHEQISKQCVGPSYTGNM